MITVDGQSFVEFLVKHEALMFEDVELKSGRVSPYYFNLGLLNTGEQLAGMGKFFAKAIQEAFGEDFDIVFGPAYKGIPLSVAIVAALSDHFGVNKRYGSNRKEAKTRGEGGILLGSKLHDGDKIILVDDVVATGATKIEAVELLRSIADVDIKGLVIGLDRLETDPQGNYAIEEFTKQTGVPVVSLINTNDLLEHLDDGEVKGKIEGYLGEYGVERE